MYFALCLSFLICKMYHISISQGCCKAYYCKKYKMFWVACMCKYKTLLQGELQNFRFLSEVLSLQHWTQTNGNALSCSIPIRFAFCCRAVVHRKFLQCNVTQSYITWFVFRSCRYCSPEQIWWVDRELSWSVSHEL